MPPLELKIGIGQFRQLPRNAAYKYEYFGGSAWLTPRPRYYHALLRLPAVAAAPTEPAPVALRRVTAGDWEAMVPIFAAAFRTQQPFGGLEDEPRRTAARKSLEQTRTGGDGPLIAQAAFVAVGEAEADAEPPLLGALLPTLLPAGDPTDWDSYHWPEPPPPDCIAGRLGRPHLTWIFVAPSLAGQGVGTALLQAAVRELVALGFTEMASTFLAGNDSSMLWHWRAGFELLAYPASRRRGR
jgi:GNAT superfamily N-acetyltransferase